MKIAETMSWRMGEDVSVPLSAALFVRDWLKLPATEPYYIPPVVPAVPEHIPVIGPELDEVLADEWPMWFGDLPAKGGNYLGPGMLLDERSPAFRQAVEGCLDAALRSAQTFREEYALQFQRNMKVQGMLPTRLVRSIEKELGHRAAPFNLHVRILPVEGAWLHRAAPDLVLLSAEARRDPGHLYRLLGPVIRDLA